MNPLFFQTHKSSEHPQKSFSNKIPPQITLPLLSTHTTSNAINLQSDWVIFCGGVLEDKSNSETFAIELPSNYKDVITNKPIEFKCQRLTPMEIKRYGHTMCFLDDGFMILGGHNGVSYLNSTEKFRFCDNRWFVMPDMHLQRNFSASCKLDNGCIIVCGGINIFSVLQSVEMFDPHQHSWRTLPHMTSRRHSFACVSIGNDIYVIGGRDSPGNHGCPQKTCERLSLDVGRSTSTSPSWKPIASLGKARFGHSAVTFDGKIYIAGGTNGLKAFDNVDVYDPKIDRWIAGPPLNVARAWSVLAVWGGKLLVIGGYDPAKVEDAVQEIEVLKADVEGSTWELFGSISMVGTALTGGVFIPRDSLKLVSPTVDVSTPSTIASTPESCNSTRSQPEIDYRLFGDHIFYKSSKISPITAIEQTMSTEEHRSCPLEYNKARLRPVIKEGERNSTGTSKALNYEVKVDPNAGDLKEFANSKKVKQLKEYFENQSKSSKTKTFKNIEGCS